MRWVPRSKSGQVRLATLGFGLVMITAPAGLLHAGAATAGSAIVLSIVALVLLLGIVVVTAVIRRQLSIWEGPATAVLTVLVGMGLAPPHSVVGIGIGVIVAQSMYGSLFSEFVRVVAFLVVIPATFALSLNDDGLAWNSAISLSLIPILPLFAALVRLIKSTLEEQGQAKARVRFMSRLTSDLLAAESLDQPRQLMAEAAVELTRKNPGLIGLGAVVSGDGEIIIGPVFGLDDASMATVPKQLPADLIADLPEDRSVVLHELKGMGRRMVELGLPKQRRWYVHRDDDGPETASSLVIFGLPRCPSDRIFGIPGQRSTELLFMIRTLVEQRRSAYLHLYARQQVLAIANRDDVTGLLKRTSFMPRLNDLLQDGEGPVALIFISFDGLAALAVESGSASALVAAYRLARRLLGVVDELGPSCRFSDNRFVVAVPMHPALENAIDQATDDVTVLATSLRRELSEPVHLPGRSVTLSISVGIARSEPGTTAEELVERAAAALRVDQADAVRPLVRTA